MGRWWRLTACERARQWISLELDGELSELEQVALARHLDGCPACREVKARVAGFTALVRGEPLAEPARPVAVELPRVWQARVVRRGVAALSAVVAAAALLAALVLEPSGAPSSSLGFRTVGEQQQFARDHARTEPQLFLEAVIPWSAERALG